MSKYPFRHDHFFKHFFQIREIALEHIQDYVSPDLVALMDLSSLTLLPTVRVDDELQESRSDLAYGCCLDNGRNLLLALLHEHKSEQPEYDIRLQINDYRSDIWSVDIQQRQALTFVLPLVIYNGKTKWKKRPFRDSFPGLPDEFLPFLGEFDYLLLDLPGMSDEEIIRRSPGKMLASAFLALKHGREPEYFRKNFVKVFNFDWKRYASSIRQTFLNALLSYVSSATGFTKKEFQQLAKPLPKPLNNFIMVTMESILEEGMVIGIEKGEVIGIEKGEVIGIEKKTKEFAIKLIHNFPKLSNEKIAEMTGLSKASVIRLRKELKNKPNGLNGNPNKT